MVVSVVGLCWLWWWWWWWWGWGGGVGADDEGRRVPLLVQHAADQLLRASRPDVIEEGGQSLPAAAPDELRELQLGVVRHRRAGCVVVWEGCVGWLVGAELSFFFFF